MKEAFEVWNPSASTLRTVNLLSEVIEEYRRQGYSLSVRQLYYQMVSRGYVANSQQSYGRIVSIVGKARNAGMLDWLSIEDRTRSTAIPWHPVSAKDLIVGAAKSYSIDKWFEQPNHVEVFCEKDALSGVLEPACRELEVNFTANRGYASLSLMYEVGKRLEEHAQDGKDIHLFYFGDHDPSGIDMDRDIADRLSLYSGWSIDVKRLALLMDQVNDMNVPENPAKTKDSRYASYIRLYGTSSWELDAVEPSELVRLVTDAVLDLRDDDLWEEAVEEEEETRNKLVEYASAWREPD
jgi:hypothetical protein